MPRKKVLEGPIGTGWIDEVQNAVGKKFVAKWNKFVADPTKPEGRQRVWGGQYEIGPKVYHGEGLKSKRDASKKWLEICDSVMGRTTQLPPSFARRRHSNISRRRTRTDSASAGRADGRRRWSSGTTT